MTRPPTVLAVSDLVAGYGGTPILHGVSIEVGRGELVSVVGPNGAGKSTLLKAIYGLARVSGGRVAITRPSSADATSSPSLDVTGLAPHRLTALGMAYVPQINNVFPSLTVHENLELGATANPSGFEARREQMYQRYPALAEKRRQRAGSLSGGQRQMLSLARALMAEPWLLILDEPSAGLAPLVVDEMFGQLHAVNDDGISILMIEQNARRALAMSHHAYVLEMGRNRHEGAGPALAEDPEVIAIYLGGGRRTAPVTAPTASTTKSPAGDATK